MYLHLGNDVVVRNKDIIGIFDIENTSTGQITKDFLNHNTDTQISVSFDMPKSFIVCKNVNNKESIYISPISVATLKKRFLKFDKM